jgi:hypothetical protein
VSLLLFSAYQESQSSIVFTLILNYNSKSNINLGKTNGINKCVHAHLSLTSRSKHWVEYNYIVHNVKGSINIGEY